MADTTQASDDELRKLLESFYGVTVAPITIDTLYDAIHQHTATAVEEATKPPLDLNAYENQLESQVSDIDAFNLFIKKWCPHASHLLDSDDNDGEYIRQRITELAKEARIDELKLISKREWNVDYADYIDDRIAELKRTEGETGR